MCMIKCWAYQEAIRYTTHTIMTEQGEEMYLSLGSGKILR